MKQKKKRAGQLPGISAETIELAVKGDKAATEKVMEAYEPYIIAQSTIKTKDANGVTKEAFDEDLAQSLRMALLEAIPKFTGSEEV